MSDLENGVYSLKNLERFAWLMDDRFRIPIINKRVGWDFIIGLIPVGGDLITLLASLYIFMGGWHQGVGKGVLLRMLGNIGIDFLIGLVPLVGDFLDAGFKSNKRNLRLLLNSLRSQQDSSRLRKTK